MPRIVAITNEAAQVAGQIIFSDLPPTRAQLREHAAELNRFAQVMLTSTSDEDRANAHAILSILEAHDLRAEEV